MQTNFVSNGKASEFDSRKFCWILSTDIGVQVHWRSDSRMATTNSLAIRSIFFKIADRTCPWSSKLALIVKLVHPSQATTESWTIDVHLTSFRASVERLMLLFPQILALACHIEPLTYPGPLENSHWWLGPKDSWEDGFIFRWMLDVMKFLYSVWVPSKVGSGIRGSFDWVSAVVLDSNIVLLRTSPRLLFGL